VSSSSLLYSTNKTFQLAEYRCDIQLFYCVVARKINAYHSYLNIRKGQVPIKGNLTLIF